MHRLNFEPLVGVQQNMRLSIPFHYPWFEYGLSIPDPSLAQSESGTLSRGAREGPKKRYSHTF